MVFQTGGEVQKPFQVGGEVNQPQDDQQVSQLVQQLGGRLPLSPEQQLQRRVFEPRVTIATAAETQQRQQAFQELQQKGFTSEQLRFTLESQKIIDPLPVGRVGGGIAGAIGATALAGRVIPGPFDDAAILGTLIASAGAGAGGVAGQAAQTAMEDKRALDREEILGAFLTEAGTELGGRGIVRAGKLLFSPIIKKTVPKAAALLDEFANVGGNFSPSELDRRFTLRVGEAFSRGSFGAKEIFQEFEEKQGKAVLAFADNIIESIGEGIARETPEQIGEAFAGGITRPGGRVFGILDDLFDPLFKQIDDLGAGATISTKSLKNFAKKQLVTDNRLNKQFLSPIGREKLNKIIGMVDDVSFSDMRTLRSSFLKDARKMARDVDQSQGIIKQLAGITDDAIFSPKAARGLNPKALNLLRNTNALYKASQKGLETTFSESLTKRLLKNPSRVTKELFPNNNPKAVRLLRQSLVEPVSGTPSTEGKILWNQLRQAWLADAVEQSTREGVANPKTFNNIIRKLGPESFDEMFPEKQVASNVRKIQDLFETAGKAPPTGASLFARGAQVAGLIKMYDSGKQGDFLGFTAGAGLALGPLAFAKLATNPGGIKLLATGLKLKPGASGLIPNAARMVRLLRDINRREDNQKLRSLRTESLLKQARKQPGLEQLRGFGGRGF